MPSINSIKRDTDKSENGVWVEYAKDVEVCIRPMPNKEFNEFLQRSARGRGRARRRMQENDDIDVQRRAVAHHVLIDWKNVEDEDGNPLPYTPEAVGEFVSGEFEDLYLFVVGVASDETLYRKEEAEEEAKNSLS